MMDQGTAIGITLGVTAILCVTGALLMSSGHRKPRYHGRVIESGSPLEPDCHDKLVKRMEQTGEALAAFRAQAVYRAMAPGVTTKQAERGLQAMAKALRSGEKRWVPRYCGRCGQRLNGANLNVADAAVME